MKTDEEWQEARRREEVEHRDSIRRMKERMEARSEKKSAKDRAISWGITSLGFVVTAFVFLAPMKLIDWSNCQSACERNGDEAFWQISLGCLCDDGDGLYNPKDER